MPYGISTKNIQRLLSIFPLFPEVEAVILFGSRARGKFREVSDVDLALKGNDIQLHTLLRISAMLDDLLLPVTVDLLIYEHVSDPALLHQIDKEGLYLYHKISTSVP
jgi:predicted nucleotidyltransferase